MELLGKVVAEKIQEELGEEIKKIEGQGKKVSLAVLLVGDDPASATYVRAKEKMAEKLGIDFRLYHFAMNCRESQVLDLIDELNSNEKITGMIIQLPLPKEFDSQKIIQRINPKKDIDGLLGEMSPPTARAILELLAYYKIELTGKIVLVGHGKLVGEPLGKILKERNIPFEVCDRDTKDLVEKTRAANIIVSATGVPGLITPEMVGENAVVIDAGTAESEGSVKGDVDPEVYHKVRAYSPVPGGVGPLTVVMLMENLVEAAKNS